MKKRFEACVQAIHFLLKNFGEMDRLKIVKLIYFADKRHLILGGRTITNDNYVAMNYGPVGSMVLDVLKRTNLKPEQLNYADQYIRKTEIGEYKYECATVDMMYDQFSESDLKTLTKIGEKFKSMDAWELVELTHKYPEWTQFQTEFADSNACKPIRLVELFSTIDDDPLGIPHDVVKDSRAMYLGYED
jgi:uncharacterized phage-associated protein